MVKKSKKIPEPANLKCKDCGSEKFEVHVLVAADGTVEADEIECAACAVEQYTVMGTIEGTYVSTTLEEES